MPYFAHSGKPDDKSGWQTLRCHLNETAELAASFAAPLGLERLAFLTALFHDLGKYDPRFQQRLEGKNIRVDHSTAGAAVLRNLVKGQGAYPRIMMELAACASVDRNFRIDQTRVRIAKSLASRERGSKLPVPAQAFHP